MESPSSMTIDSTTTAAAATSASEKENDVVMIKSRKRSSAAISHLSAVGVVTPPRPSSSASGGGDNTQVDGEPPVASPPLIDIINIETGGLTETEHLLFLHGPEFHRKGSSAALLDLINIDDDCDVVNKLVDVLFRLEEQDSDDSEEQVVGDDDEFSLFDSSKEHDTVIENNIHKDGAPPPTTPPSTSHVVSAQVDAESQVASSRHTQLDGEPPVAAVQVSSSSSSAAGVRNDVADIGAAALAAGVCDDDDDVTTVVQTAAAAAAAAAAAVTATIDTNNTFDSNDDDDGAATVVEPSVAMPLVVEDPKTILLQNVDCYVSGLLASFKRTTLIKMVHEVLILYPQSEYAIENERPILHQRCGGRPGQVGCTYIKFEWNHIKEVIRALGKKALGCNGFVKHFRACFVDNSNIGCTEIAKQGRWCGIIIYGPWAECTNHYDITRYLNWRDVSSLCLDHSQDCALNVYAQSLGDDGKFHGNNKNHHVASFSVPSGGSIMMSKIATGCSGEGLTGLPLTLPTIHHEKTYFTHQSKQIPCIRMALIVDFEELEQKKYQTFLQEKYIPDSLVFTPEIQDELTRQFQQPNTGPVRTIHQEKWLVNYNELLKDQKYYRSIAFMCDGKLGTWVKTQRTQYRFLQEKKKSNMTAERIKLLEMIGFTWKTY